MLEMLIRSNLNMFSDFVEHCISVPIVLHFAIRECGNDVLIGLNPDKPRKRKGGRI